MTTEFCPNCDNLLNISKYGNNEGESFETNQLYYKCNSCNWTQKIKEETNLLNKMYTSNTNYINFSNLENKIYSNILPYTAEYICPNKKCPGNTDRNKHEAVMYRIDNNIKIYYTCCACKTTFNP